MALHTIFLGFFNKEASKQLCCSHVPSLWLHALGTARTITLPWLHRTSSALSQNHLLHSKRLESKSFKNKKLLGKGTKFSLMFINHQSQPVAGTRMSRTGRAGKGRSSLPPAQPPCSDHFGLSLHVYKHLKVHKINSRQILVRHQVESTSPSFWEFIVQPLLSSGGSLQIKDLINFPFAKLTKKMVLSGP